MKVSNLGHSCFEIHISGNKLLVDPFISGNPKAEGIDISMIEPDLILITHAHRDHILDVEKIGKRCNAPILSNYEIVSSFKKKGIPGYGMNYGGTFEYKQIKIKYTLAAHSSSFPDGSYGGQPGGFVIWDNHACLYIAGDTALTMDMKLIPMTCPKLDCAILPIGDRFTMGVEDAVIASEFVQCSKIIGCHYNTFEDIEIDTEAAKQCFRQEGKELLLPEIGETINI